MEGASTTRLRRGTKLCTDIILDIELAPSDHSAMCSIIFLDLWYIPYEVMPGMLPTDNPRIMIYGLEPDKNQTSLPGLLRGPTPPSHGCRSFSGSSIW